MVRFVSIFILVLSLAISPVYAQSEDPVLDVQIIQSETGIEAWLVEDHSLPIIAAEFLFLGAGSVTDPVNKQGLARLVSNTLDEGAGDLDSQAFAKILEDLSISLRFNSGRDNFGGSLKTLSRNKDKAFELLKLALTKPRFDQDAVQRMRVANLARIKSSLSNPSWITARLVNDRIFEGHPYALNSGGTLTTLQNITRADLQSFTKGKLGRENLRVAVVGDITPDELKNVLDSVFGTLPDKTDLKDVPYTEIKNTGTVSLYERDIPQTVIQMVQPGIDRSHPDYQTAQVMNYILGGGGFGTRLTSSAREEKGLTYGIYSYFYAMEDAALLKVQTSTKNESVAEMLGIVREEWQRMQDEQVTDQELQQAKAYLVGSLPLQLTSTHDIASLMISLMADGLAPDYLDRRAKKIEAVTTADIQRVAKDLLKPDQFTTVLVGKPANVEATKVFENLPNVE